MWKRRNAGPGRESIQGVDMKKQGQFQMLVTDKTIVIIGRKWRSKWWFIECMCSKWRRRKDGTCKHERQLMATVHPSMLARTRIRVQYSGE